MDEKSLSEMAGFPQIRACGDSALTVVFGNSISPEINDRVYSLMHALQENPPEGLLEMVPSFASLLVCFDRRRTSRERMRALILKLSERISSDNKEKKKTVWDIPVCYSSRFAPDLRSVAEICGLSEDEVIRKHSSGLYRIYMLGFLPGFVYLGGMDPSITCPRLPTPRKKIPRGAVGIGGSQTGIYPLESPGGWRLIGSTPVPMYDPSRAKPVLCRPGDFIRFIPVTTCQYYDIANDVARGTWTPETEMCTAGG